MKREKEPMPPFDEMVRPRVHGRRLDAGDCMRSLASRWISRVNVKLNRKIVGHSVFPVRGDEEKKGNGGN